MARAVAGGGARALAESRATALNRSERGLHRPRAAGGLQKQAKIGFRVQFLVMNREALLRPLFSFRYQRWLNC